MYSVANFGHMVACGSRTDAYVRAIARTVKPGSVVLDIGAGSGVFSLLAAKAGARKVYAVEPNPAIFLLPELAAENGVADRIEIHPVSLRDLVLPEKVDVVIADLRGSFPVTGDHLAAMRDAKQRFLADGGIIIPERDRLRVALVEARALHSDLVDAATALETVGLKGSAIVSSIFNTATNDSRGQLHANDVLTSAPEFLVLEYGTVEGPFERTVRLLPRRKGVAHGLALWFDAEIQGELGFDTAPGADVVYARGYLPLLEPVHLDPDDVIEVTLRVDDHGDRWAWETAVTTGSGKRKAMYRQSTFFGLPTSAATLLKGTSSFVPRVAPKGERHRAMLAMMDGERTVGEIVVAAQARFPAEPASRIEEEVRELVSLYSR